MSGSPSARRREGREAYFRGGVAFDHLPYKARGLTQEIHAKDWLEGWAEAKAHDDLARQREEREALDEDEKVEEFARLYNLAKDRGLIK